MPLIASLQCVVLDCSDAPGLAQFYQSLLGGVINQPDPRWSLDENWSTLHTGSGVVLCFQRVEDHQQPRWPDPARPQQFHLDLAVRDLDDAHEQVLKLGATPLGTDDQRSWRIYADPAGHPFCLVHEPLMNNAIVGEQIASR
jgi:glyoxalase superfamily protein